MTETQNFALACAAPANARSSEVPGQFRNAVDRHGNDLVALSVALQAARITPVTATLFIDAALACFQDGLIAAAAGSEEAYLG